MNWVSMEKMEIWKLLIYVTLIEEVMGKKQFKN